MGKRIKLSNGRRLVDDIVYLASKMPMEAFTGDFDSGMVAAFRRRTRPKVSWNVLYMKAYAAVCKQNPELRRTYVKFPWGHLYEHHCNVCMITIAREYEGEERLLFARFHNPEEKSLAELQELYDFYRTAPIEEVKHFRHQINFAKAPALIRRLTWWAMFNLFPATRASHMGTFGMSISGYKGVFGSKHLGTNTTILGVDPVPRKGVSRILLTFDHRVLDGTPVTRMMQELHQTLTTGIKAELAEMIGVNPTTGEPLSEEEKTLSEEEKDLRQRQHTPLISQTSRVA